MNSNCGYGTSSSGVSIPRVRRGSCGAQMRYLLVYGHGYLGALGFAASVLTQRRAKSLTLGLCIFILFMVTISRIDFIGCAPPNGGCNSSETAYRKVSNLFILAASDEDEQTPKIGEIIFSKILGSTDNCPPVRLVRMDYPAYCAGYGIFFAPNAPTMPTKTFVLSPVLALNVPATELR